MSDGEKVLTDEAGFPVLFDLVDLGIEALQADVITSRGFIRNNGDAVRALTKALVEAFHFGKTRKKETLDILSRCMKTSDQKVLEAAYTPSIALGPSKPYPSLNGVEVALAELASRNPKAASAKPEQFVDMSFIAELDRSGFIDSLYRR